MDVAGITRRCGVRPASAPIPSLPPPRTPAQGQPHRLAGLLAPSTSFAPVSSALPPRCKGDVGLSQVDPAAVGTIVTPQGACNRPFVAGPLRSFRKCSRRGACPTNEDHRFGDSLTSGRTGMDRPTPRGCRGRIHPASASRWRPAAWCGFSSAASPRQSFAGRLVPSKLYAGPPLTPPLLRAR